MVTITDFLLQLFSCSVVQLFSSFEVFSLQRMAEKKPEIDPIDELLETDSEDEVEESYDLLPIICGKYCDRLVCAKHQYCYCVYHENPPPLNRRG